VSGGGARSTKRTAWGYLAAVYAYLYAPILVLVAFSFNASRQTAVWGGFTWDWYAKAWNDDAVVSALRTSLAVALATTAVSVAAGVPAALALGRHRFRGRGAAGALFTLPIAIPEVVLGFASVAFFGLAGWRLGFGTVLAAHVAFSLSYVVFVVRARLALLDPTLEAAAADLGATPLEAFAHVTLPLLAPAIVASALLVFTISLDDYVVTSFVAGRGGTTLPLQIYSMVRTGVTPEVNAVSTILLVATVVLAALAERLRAGRVGRGAVAAICAVGLGLGLFAAGGAAREAGRRELSIYIWSNYLTDEMIREFEARYNVRVRVETYESNEALLAKLQTGVADYDLVVPSDYMVTILSAQGLLEEIDAGRLANFENLAPRFRGLPFDPENRYSIPYTWGTTGFGYRRDLVSGDLHAWRDLWDSRFRDRIGMLDDSRENFAAALKRLGLTLNATDESELERAARELERLRPNVRAYDSDAFAESLLAGDGWAAQGYNGQIAKAARENPNIVYVVPAEGCTLFVDNLCIPRGAPNRDLAILFLDFVLEGKTAAEITTTTGYATPNLAARDFLAPELRDDPAIFPPDDALDGCELMRDVGDATELYDALWTRLKS
jgi:spermidine/putrescine transport system permease protein